MNYICENCGCSHDGTYGSGRFCSHTCQAKNAFRKASKHAAYNKSVKARLKHMQLDNVMCICEQCGISYIRKNGISSRFCSRKCANTRVHSQQTKEKIASSLRDYANVHSKPKLVRLCKNCRIPISKNVKQGIVEYAHMYRRSIKNICAAFNLKKLPTEHIKAGKVGISLHTRNVSLSKCSIIIE